MLQNIYLSKSENNHNHSNKKILIYNFIKFVGVLFITSFKSVYAKVKLGKKYSTQIKSFHSKNNKLSLLKTFVYDNDLKHEKYSDAFWGSLPQHLIDKNIPFTRIIEPLGNYNKIVKFCKMQDNIFLSFYFVKFLDPLKVLFLAIRGSLKSFPGNISFCEKNISNTLRRQFLAELWSPAGCSALFQYLIYKNSCKKIKFDNFLLIYEGLVWEKMAILAFRKFNKNSKIIGYQHAVIPESATNFYLKENDSSPFPDTIYTVGSATSHILKTYGQHKSTTVQTSCALKSTLKFELDTQTDKSIRNKLLVALEGIPQSLLLVNFILQEAISISNWDIVIRPHPLFPIDKILAQLKNQSIPHNVSFSRNTSLYSDLKKNDVILYWGTTVSLEALSQSKPVIHYKIKNSLLSYDPLFLLDSFKWTVSDPGDLKVSLEEIASLSAPDKAERLFKAQQFIKCYFHPATTENLNIFLEGMS